MTCARAEEDEPDGHRRRVARPPPGAVRGVRASPLRRRLRANDVLVVDGWEEAYTQRFSGAAGSPGNRPIVVSYASSPSAEVIFRTPRPDETIEWQALLAEPEPLDRLQTVRRGIALTDLISTDRQ